MPYFSWSTALFFALEAETEGKEKRFPASFKTKARRRRTKEEELLLGCFATRTREHLFNSRFIALRVCRCVVQTTAPRGY